MTMRGNEGRSLPERRSASQVERWLRRARIVASLLVLALLVAGAMLLMFQSESHFPLGITYEPWEVADPGPPKIVGQPKVDPLRFEVLEEGAGPAAETGDLIQVSLRGSDDPPEKEEDGWIWIGFQMRTPFVDPRLLAAFIGQKEGGALRFTESPMDSRSAGRVYPIPLGNPRQYAWRKGIEVRERSIYALGSSGYTVVSIKKVFKGSLKYRGIRLHDDNWIHRSPFWGLEKAPTRHIGLQEARFEGVSAEGRRATFQYGPWLGSGKSWFWISIPSDVLGAEDYRRMERWIAEAWEKLPVGVQVE
jgi:hypothetical protein